MDDIKKLAEQAKRYGSLTVTLDVDAVLALQQKLDAAEKDRDAAKLEYDVLNDQIKYWNEQAKALAAENLDLKHPGTYLPSKRETPATDAFLNALRAEGIHFAANRILAAWESGFVDDTPAQAFDISGAVLSALEFLPNASPGEFTRDYADEVRAAIAAQLRAGDSDKDGK